MFFAVFQYPRTLTLKGVPAMNIYLQQIRDICLPNKYTKWYCNIISKRFQQFSSRKEAKETLGYVEGHHILPKAFKMGGEKDKENIVFLTAREHFIVHMLLIKMIGGEIKHRMSSSLIYMSNKTSMSSITYETVRILYSKYHPSKTESARRIVSQQHKGKVRSEEDKRKQSESTKGRSKSEDHRRKIGEAQKGDKHHMFGKNHSPESKQKISNANSGENHPFYGKKHSEETKRKQSVAKKGRTSHLKGIKQQVMKCPHCKKEGGKSNMTRWHFDKCKFKN